jgi:UDP-hydrolysing UDP-N-acetyl-D-glucosamine 2-epimerase
MRKICVVLTARTSYTKIKPILSALNAHSKIELQVVCAASAVLERYGKVDHIVESDGFIVNERIYMILEADNLLTSAKSTGVGIIEFAGAFSRLKPDLVLVMADRYEVLAPAIAASYQNIPLAHVQGGEVSGNIDEKVRHAITKLADIHFPASKRASEWLIRMGEREEVVHCTGCPSTDIASEVLKNPALDFDVYEKYGGVGSSPDLSNGFIIVMQHPVTTEFHDARKQVAETLYAVSEVNRPVLWFWPNPDAGSDETSKMIRSFREQNKSEKLHFIKNMEPLDFLRLLYSSDGIIGNSSVAIRECSYLGVPAINIGSRQANRERGPNVIDVSYNREEIKNAILSHFKGHVERSYIYGEGNAGQQIASILAEVSYSYSKSINYI